MGNACTRVQVGAPAGKKPSGAPVRTSEAIDNLRARERSLALAKEEFDKLVRSHECGIADIISGKRLQGADADNVMLHLEVLAVEISGNKEHYNSILMAAANGTNPLNNLGLQIDPSRKEFSFAALSVITQMSSEIRQGQLDSSSMSASQTQRARVRQLKHAWNIVLGSSLVRCYIHPRLGRVPVVQPLIHTCIQWLGSEVADDETCSASQIVKDLMDLGARVDVRSSLGLSTMHAAVEACERFGTKHSKSNYHDNLERNLQMVRTLANRGASVLQKSLPFSGHTAQMRFGGAGLQKMIAEGHALNAAQACSWWQDGYTKADAVLKKLQAVLDELAIKEGHRLADGNMRGLGLANSEQHHASRPTALQSMFNMLWAMQQLTALSSAEQRRGMLMEMSSSAPFSIPVMRVVSFSTFKDLGRFPDDASASGDENKSQTCLTPISELPSDAQVIFISNRKEPLASYEEVLNGVGAMVDEEDLTTNGLYLWLGQSSTESNSYITALPGYMSCCEHFAHFTNPGSTEGSLSRMERLICWRMRCHTVWWRLVRGVAYQEPPLVPNLDEEYATEANMPPGMDRSLFSNIMAVFTWTDSRVSRVRSIDAMTMKQADLTPQMLASNLIAENS